MAKEGKGRLLIGTSGWVYRHWKGNFYPDSLDPSLYLPYYSHRFPTVEINYSFYRLPSFDNFALWRQQTPPAFLFAVKASRYLTHFKKLRDPSVSLDRFFDAVAGLGPKLGPILFQLPPHWKKNVSRLADFLSHLPANHRYAFEFRDPSWLSNDVYYVLSNHHVAVVLADYKSMPPVLHLTSNFTYVRLHGGQYETSYSKEELEVWGDRIRFYLRDGVDVYVYFNNDQGGAAPSDALTLEQLVRVEQTG